MYDVTDKANSQSIHRNISLCYFITTLMVLDSYYMIHIQIILYVHLNVSYILPY